MKQKAEPCLRKLQQAQLAIDNINPYRSHEVQPSWVHQGSNKPGACDFGPAIGIFKE